MAVTAADAGAKIGGPGLYLSPLSGTRELG
jgi:hypothetical protein